jgi:hypothetical protein
MDDSLAVHRSVMIQNEYDDRDVYGDRDDCDDREDGGHVSYSLTEEKSMKGKSS